MRASPKAAKNWTQTRTYLSNRDLLDVIETKISTTSKAKFEYDPANNGSGYDAMGRRTVIAKTGEMFDRYGNGSQGLDTNYGYDDRSQLTSEQTKLGGTSTVLTGRDDGYAFDNIGNRSSTSGTTHNSNAASYTINALNQYTQRTVPGVFDVAGAAGSGATVTVNGSASGVTRHGEYFFKGHGMANNPNPVYSTLAISDGGTPVNLPAFTAGTPEAFAYDADGNLTSDGRWDYTYDAENRLVSIQTHTALSPSPLPNADARRIEFKNDYLGRRVEKIVRSGWNGSTFATVISDEKFVYDGWNMIARLNALSSNALVASYFWGLDWSGTLQGAGGVGGLLMVQEGGNSYLPMYDGNGNVMGMIKASDGTIAAAYEYDAFGNTLRESGPYAASNPFRFSTKYTDIETGLVYYGLRYYSPTLGRFLNQDPIAEKGGLNLYAFCGNNGVNRWDYLGMYEVGDYVMGWTCEMERGPDENGAMQYKWTAYDSVSIGEDTYFGVAPPYHVYDRTLDYGPVFEEEALVTNDLIYDLHNQQVEAKASRNAGSLAAHSAAAGYAPASPGNVNTQPAPNSGVGWLRQGASIGVGFIPLVGSGQSLVELISGKDYITGERANRWLAAGGLVAGLVPFGKGALKGGAKIFSAGAKSADEAVDIAKVVVREGEGVIYKRINPHTGAGYIGQSIDDANYAIRQYRHTKAGSVPYVFDQVGSARRGVDLNVLEEAFIRSEGGLMREGGLLQNLRHQMNPGSFVDETNGLLRLYQGQMLIGNGVLNGGFGTF